jgi:kynurenine 3-monooxygenase
MPLAVAVVGAGLTGCVAAALLDRLGLQVSLFEKRPRHSQDFGDHPDIARNAAKRSINLALSHRGIETLRLLDPKLLDEVLQSAVRMPRRVIHGADSSITLQPYGLADQTLYSISRELLNSCLLRYVEKGTAVQTHFNCAISRVDVKEGVCYVEDRSMPSLGHERAFKFDLIIGADGAYSQVCAVLTASNPTLYPF